MLTVFHAEQFKLKISQLEVDDEIKQGFNDLVNDFLKDLLSIADFDISELSNKEHFQSIKENYTNNKTAGLKVQPAVL